MRSERSFFSEQLAGLYVDRPKITIWPAICLAKSSFDPPAGQRNGLEGTPAVTAMKFELLPVLSTLQYFGRKERCTSCWSIADDSYQTVCCCAVTLAALLLLFQGGHSHFGILRHDYSSARRWSPIFKLRSRLTQLLKPIGRSSKSSSVHWSTMIVSTPRYWTTG